MSGLLFLAVSFVWLVLAIWVTRWLMRRIRTESTIARLILMLLIFGLILASPVADEIIGGIQFRELCRENAVLRIDAEKAKGKMVREVIGPSNEVLQGTIITVYHTHLSYRDSTTGQEIASTDSYVAKGGFLIRTLGLFEGNEPLFVFPSVCSERGGHAIARAYGFKLIK